MTPSLWIGSWCPPVRRKQAEALAETLGAPLSKAEPRGTGLALFFGLERVELRSLGRKAPGPLWVDFNAGGNAHRRRFGGGRGQALARACGLKPGFDPIIVDATAGLGRDGFVLASLGCHVTLIERDAIVACLLRDGLERGRDAPDCAAIVERMCLIEADAGDWLAARRDDERPDTVYLDPMFPHRDKSAAVKKEMGLFQELLGPPDEEAALLANARSAATRRVAVKRPAKAPALDGIAPHSSIPGKTTRFDLYMPTRAPSSSG